MIPKVISELPCFFKAEKRSGRGYWGSSFSSGFLQNISLGSGLSLMDLPLDAEAASYLRGKREPLYPVR